MKGAEKLPERYQDRIRPAALGDGPRGHFTRRLGEFAPDDGGAGTEGL